MPMPAYLTLKGENQGEIEGSCDQMGHEGEILVEAFDHQIDIPRDRQTGLPTGPRVHGPMMVTKFFDKASPKLYQALASGEQMSEVMIKWYRINPMGSQEHYFTTKLQEAIIVSIEAKMENCLDPDKESFGHMEEVSFTYSKIIWTWVPDGIESEDSWKAPRE